MKPLNGLALAAATAIMLTGCNSMQQKADGAEMKMKTAASDAAGKCVGGNSCAGHSMCKTASSECAGQNACKGQGFTMTSKADCDTAGGTFEG